MSSTYTLNYINYEYTVGQPTAFIKYTATVITGAVTILSSFVVDNVTYTVTSISNASGSASGFNGCQGITSITIPNTVTMFGYSAFNNCKGLTSIIIPNSVTIFLGSTFSNCTNLASITLSNSLTFIGSRAFHTCTSLTSITIPNSVTTIGDRAFTSCSALTSIIIPSSVTSIDTTEMFYDCTRLTSITFLNSPTTFSTWCFYNCTSLTSVTIPNSVTSIGSSAFAFCTALTSITIPNSVTSIGNSAFNFCTGLTSITIPNSVTSIGNSVFSFCTALTSVNVDPDNQFYSSENGVLFNKNKTTLILFPIASAITSFVIPDSVVSLGTFYGCTKLTSIIIPSSISNIDAVVFYGCDALTTVRFMGIIPSIGSNNFSATGDTVYYKTNFNTNQTTALDKLTMFTNKSTFSTTELIPTITNFSFPTITTEYLPFTITDPSSNSTGAFVYLSSNTTVATIVGNVVTIVGGGSCAITANQLSTTTYITNTITATLTVPPRTPTITNFSMPIKKVFEGTFTIPAPTSNSTGVFTYTSSNIEVATVAGDIITIQNIVGTSTITATQAATTRYTSGTITATFQVLPPAPSILTFSMPTPKIGDTPFTIYPPASNSTGAFSYTSSNTEVATITNGNLLTYVGVGTTTITAIQEATTSYSSGTKTAVLTVSQVITTISALSISAKVFGDTPFEIINPSSNSNGLFSYTSSNTAVATIVGNTVTIIGIGSSTITATQAATTNFTSGTKTATLTVTKATPVLGNFLFTNKTIGSAAFQIDPPSSTSNGLITYVSSNLAVARISGTTMTIFGIGSSTITATQAATTNFNSGTITATFQVTNITTVLTNFFVPTQKIGNAAFQITDPSSNRTGAFTYTSSNTAVATISGKMVTIVGVGTSTITANQTAVTNYSSGTTTTVFTVNPFQDTTVLSNFLSLAKTFGDAEFLIQPPTTNSDATFTYTSSNTSVATIAGNMITIVGVGSSTITANQESTLYYTSETITTTLQVSQLTTVITGLSLSTKTFGDAAFQITTPTTNSDGLITYTSSDTSVATISGTTITIVGAGSSTITASQESTPNYTSGTIATLFTVNQVITVLTNFVVPAKTFGNAAFQITDPSSNSSGLITYTSSNVAVATISGTTITIVGGGSSTITASQASTQNYTSGTITATLQVTRATTVLTNFVVPTKKIRNAGFSITPPTTTGNGAFTYRSANTDVARIGGGSTISLFRAGTSVITATQESTSNYTSETITSLFTVEPVFEDDVSIQARGFNYTNESIRAVLNNGTIWVAGGTTLKYSTTGKTWTTVSGPAGVNSLAWTGSQWLAGCDGSNNLYTSSDAIAWNLNTSLQSYTVSKVAYANNTIFVLSVGTIFFSPLSNLGSWSSRVESVGAITGFTYTGTHYIFSSGTALILSQDLTTWTTSTLPSASTTLTINNSSQGSATVKPMTLACSDSSYNTLGYTYDGIQWYGTGNTVLQTRANHAAWNGTIWVTVGKSVGTWFAISRDGINWQQQADLLFDEAYAVAWNGSYWLVAGEGAAYSLAKSVDGVLWTGIAGSKSLFSARCSDVAWNGTWWTAYGSPTAVATSADGTVWTLLPTVVGDVSSVLLPTVTATASTGANPEYAFDLSASTAWSSGTGLYDSGTGLYSGSDIAGGEWLQIDLSSAVAVKHYSILSPNGLQWFFAGSPDELNWTVLDTQSMNFTSTSTNPLFLSIGNTTAYRYYRFVFVKVVAGSTSVQVSDADLFAVDADRVLSKYYRISNTKNWISSVVNTGYSSLMQYAGIPSAYLNTRFLNTSMPISLQTSYSYDGQYNVITDLSNTNVFYATDFSNNVFTPVSLPTMDKKYASCFNGTHFFVGGSGTNLIMYAHPTNMSAWFSTANAETTFSGGKIISLVSNSGLGFVSPPNSIYLTPGEKLSLVGPKFYDENMEKRGATFNFSLKGV